VRPRLRAMRMEPVVYVDFADEVPWQEVVTVMDTLRDLESCDDATPLVALDTRLD
jgi:hypothetical protein